jgi:lysophospholipase L1-like esterase
MRQVLVALGLVIGLSCVALAAHAATAPAARILLTGDSVTHGFHGDYTWRYRLAGEFTRQGVPVDFVGSRTSPYVKAGWSSAQYAEPNFDSDHFALGGSTLRVQAEWIAAEVTTQRPDVIVLACGVNDLRNGATPAQTDLRLRAWIAAARAAKPDVRIIISPVLDAIDPARAWLHQAIRDYNALVAVTVPELSTPTSPVTLSDTTRGWSAQSLTAENLHPTPTGETLIAQRIAETFHHLGDLPSTPSMYRPTAWNRIARVQATIKDQRAVLTWDHQALTAGRISIRRLGYPASLPSANYVGGTATTPFLVPGARYEFRVQYVRGRIATPFGPIAAITALRTPSPAAVSRVVVNSAGIRWTRSPTATHYLVSYRRAQARRWVTVRTTGLAVRTTRAKRARVWAVNGGGRSPMRAGVR